MITDDVKLSQITNKQSNSALLTCESIKQTLNAYCYIKSHLDGINKALLEYGAILLRGFVIQDLDSFGQISAILTDKLMDYSYRSSPRKQIHNNVFTSTEYPREFYIPLHNECSYSKKWPNRIFFLCTKPPQQMGETPIADSRVILNALDKAIVNKFKEKGIMYIRYFYKNIGMSWQEVFQVNNKRELEVYCTRNAINFEWQDNGILKVYNICDATTVHPITKEETWFNQAHLFNIHSFNDEIKNQFIDTFGVDKLPRNSVYGDGEAIEQSVIKEIMDVYSEQMIKFKWKKSDLLLLDNILFAHGRMPFIGERKIVVTMGSRAYDRS
ncbi:MAG: TauD/TfdA family dioxygenase [Rickettsiales bacterium]|jgi:hypothetical protein|nr:TauD/TfdA family dioxygenase [Rickettsiales bacterium]